MVTYYKVVTVNRRGEYHSAVIIGKARLRYALGERTVGFEGMPVLVFNTLTTAREFSIEANAVLAGAAGNPRRQDQVCDMIGGLRGFRAFWRKLPNWFREWAAEAPDGTYAAEWFEPKRVV